MRPLRYVLRLIFALEALGFLSLAILTLHQSKLVEQRLHLGPVAIVEVSWFIILMALVSAMAALRLKGGDPLGRWLLLAASIFNLMLFPFGVLVAAAGIYYFTRNPAVQPKIEAKHRPIAGDGTSRWSGTIFTTAQVMWGVFVFSSIRRWTVARGMPEIRSEVLLWITLAGAVYGAVVFHELGHFVVGDIVRFRLIGFGLGPLSWAYAGGRWRAHIRYDKLFGGHTAMAPTTPSHIRGRVMILTLGGPLASAMLGMTGAVCLLLIPGPDWPAALGRMVALATGFAFGDLIFNLLPMASEADYSDGARLWQMYRRGPWCDFHCANHYMGLSQTTPLRPRDWPTAMVERAAEFAGQLREPAGTFAMAYTHFLDRCDWERALSWLNRAHEAARPGSNLALALTADRAFLEAFHRRDGREAQRLFAQVPRRDDSTDYWRSATTVRAVQGDLAGASKAWHKAWAMSQNRPGAGIYEMDREQLRRVGAWLERLRTEPISA